MNGSDIIMKPCCADSCVAKNAEAAAQPKAVAAEQFDQLNLEYMAGAFVISAAVMCEKAVCPDICTERSLVAAC